MSPYQRGIIDWLLPVSSKSSISVSLTWVGALKENVQRIIIRRASSSIEQDGPLHYSGYSIHHSISMGWLGLFVVVMATPLSPQSLTFFPLLHLFPILQVARKLWFISPVDLSADRRQSSQRDHHPPPHHVLNRIGGKIGIPFTVEISCFMVTVYRLPVVLPGLFSRGKQSKRVGILEPIAQRHQSSTHPWQKAHW